jgi:hypothetical protein
LYNAWCHGSQLCFHPWGVFLVLKLKSIIHILLLEIRIPCIHLLQSTILPLWRIWKNWHQSVSLGAIIGLNFPPQEVPNILL